MNAAIRVPNLGHCNKPGATLSWSSLFAIESGKVEKKSWKSKRNAVWEESSCSCGEKPATPHREPRQALPELERPLLQEGTHAWVSSWQAQWKDSQSQSADGGYSGLATWDIEEIQRNNLSMPSTHSQWQEGYTLVPPQWICLPSQDVRSLLHR